MLVLLLTACDDNAGAALARADGFLTDHPVGTAIVQVPVGREGMQAVVGTGWNGEDLAAHLAVCGTVPAFDAFLELEPAGARRHEGFVPDDVGACAREQVLSFPFEGPSRRGDLDVVHLRWRPAETAEPVSVRSTGSGLPLGLLELAPPYYRRAPEGDALVSDDDLHLDEGAVVLRPVRGAEVNAGPLQAPENWASLLSCATGKLDLVRTSLVFEDGYLEEIDTWPASECVEDNAGEARKKFRELPVEGVRLADAGNVLVVIDVPVGAR